jgi:fatty-acyl-CoA synthase
MELNLRLFLDRAARYFPDNPVVTRLPEGARHRYTYREYAQRVHSLASRLDAIGVQPGDHVATFAWNTYRHLELYFALPCAGRVLHTVNLRLADEHVAYILNHARDTAIFVDPDLLPVLERIRGELRTVRTVVVLADEVPQTTLANVIAYEDLIRDGDPDFPFAELPERTPAGMCFTSATTGMPKGVVYTHRDIYLHTITECLPDVLGLRERDTILPVVPLFHANGWGLPFAAAAVGAGLVLPGERPHAPDILDLIVEERVTFAAAAVSIGIDMIAELGRCRRDISCLRGLMLGGSATPAAVMAFYAREFGVPVYTAWGSTEMTPLATCTHIPRALADGPIEAQIPIRVRQGVPCPGTELEVLDEAGNEVPWDDKSMGEIHVRTPWSATEYFEDERTRDGFVDGWWKSGDISTVNAHGVLRLVDRAKDLIKSGGEWISSVDLENALIAHPAVREAAVVGAPDPKWLERPCAYVVLQPGMSVTEQELRAHLAPQFARWWLPDRYLVVDAIPKTGVGKINKRALRERAAADVAGAPPASSAA